MLMTSRRSPAESWVSQTARVADIIMFWHMHGVESSNTHPEADIGGIRGGVKVDCRGKVLVA